MIEDGEPWTWSDGCNRTSLQIQGDEVLYASTAVDCSPTPLAAAVHSVVINGASAEVDERGRLTVESEGGTLRYVRRRELDIADINVLNVATRSLGLELDDDGHAIGDGLWSLDAPCSAAWSEDSPTPAESHAVLEAPLTAPLLAAQRELAIAGSAVEAEDTVRQIRTVLADCRSTGSARDQWQLHFVESDEVGVVPAWSVRRRFDHDRFGRPSSEPQYRTTVFIAFAIDEVAVVLSVMHTSSADLDLLAPVLDLAAADAMDLAGSWSARSELLDGVSASSDGPLARCGGLTTPAPIEGWDDWVLSRCVSRAG